MQRFIGTHPLALALVLSACGGGADGKAASNSAASAFDGGAPGGPSGFSPCSFKITAMPGVSLVEDADAGISELSYGCNPEIVYHETSDSTYVTIYPFVDDPDDDFNDSQLGFGFDGKPHDGDVRGEAANPYVKFHLGHGPVWSCDGDGSFMASLRATKLLPAHEAGQTNHDVDGHGQATAVCSAKVNSALFITEDEQRGSATIQVSF